MTISSPMFLGFMILFLVTVMTLIRKIHGEELETHRHKVNRFVTAAKKAAKSMRSIAYAGYHIMDGHNMLITITIENYHVSHPISVLVAYTSEEFAAKTDAELTQMFIDTFERGDYQLRNPPTVEGY